MCKRFISATVREICSLQHISRTHCSVDWFSPDLTVKQACTRYSRNTHECIHTHLRGVPRVNSKVGCVRLPRVCARENVRWAGVTGSTDFFTKSTHDAFIKLYILFVVVVRRHIFIHLVTLRRNTRSQTSIQSMFRPRFNRHGFYIHAVIFSPAIKS